MGTLDWSALRDGRITDSWRRQRLLCPDCQTETMCLQAPVSKRWFCERCGRSFPTEVREGERGLGTKSES